MPTSACVNSVPSYRYTDRWHYFTYCCWIIVDHTLAITNTDTVYICIIVSHVRKHKEHTVNPIARITGFTEDYS